MAAIGLGLVVDGFYMVTFKHFWVLNFSTVVVMPCCNPLSLQKKSQADGVPIPPAPLSIMTRGHGLNKHLAMSAIQALGAENHNFTFNISH